MTMEINEKLQNFLSSAALVIDDEIENENSTISEIIKTLEESGTIFIKKRELLESVASLGNLGYVILDWDLIKAEDKAELPEGVDIGATLLEGQKERIRDFIKNILQQYFIPIFIFTRESINSIEDYLKCEPIVAEAIDKGRIFLKNKADLANDQVISSLNDWLNNSMAVYTFKVIEEAIEKAKNLYFNEMYQCNLDWPCCVYQTLLKDNPVDINSDFQEFLITSLTSTIDPISFNATGFDKTVNLTPEEILKIFSKIKFLRYSNGQAVGIHTGDMYVCENEESFECWINVSASCDLRKKRCYFVKGESKTSPRSNDIVCTYTVKRILNKKGVEFNLDKAQLIDISEDINELNFVEEGTTKKYVRVGRLLNPYIIGLQNKYSNYITRTGVLREP